VSEEMKAGRELNALIAGMMGWTFTPYKRKASAGPSGWKDPRGFLKNLPNFSTNIADAISVMAHLSLKWPEAFVGLYQKRDNDTAEILPEWEACCVFERDIDIPNARVDVTPECDALSAMALAICLAAHYAAEVDLKATVATSTDNHPAFRGVARPRVRIESGRRRS
jgi:hypothetical protein